MMDFNAILARIERLRNDQWDDIDGRRKVRLISLLPFDLAKPFLKPGISGADWKPQTQEEAYDRAREDLCFAWDKTLGHRGISASLMADVMLDWVWLLCGENQAKQVEDAPHENYGAPKLALAGKFLDINPGLIESEWELAHRMARGLPCRDSCDEGCGR